MENNHPPSSSHHQNHHHHASSILSIQHHPTISTNSPTHTTTTEAAVSSIGRQNSTASIHSTTGIISTPAVTTYPIKLACVMVGLPARGKTYIARKLVRYFDWLGYPTKIFNVGNYRRHAVGASQPHNFFDPTNPEYAQKRMELAMLALEDMISWFQAEEGCAQAEAKAAADAAVNSALKAGKIFPLNGSMHSIRAGGSGFVAVYDATNSTRERRKLIHDTCVKNGVQVMFIESICEDTGLVMSNVREVKISSPDYAGMDPVKAVQDFMKRIRHYEKLYETLTVEENVSFVKLINVGKQVQMHMIRGYLQSRIVYFLMNVNIVPRNIYFCRHGESEFNQVGRIGGDADLSQNGWAFAEKLPAALESIVNVNLLRRSNSFNSSNVSRRPSAHQALVKRESSHEDVSSPIIPVPATPLPLEPERITVWTSSLKRTMQTACKLRCPKMQWKQLDELDSGVCDGLTYEEIEAFYPEDFHERDNDKMRYRYKGGESYYDLIQRLEPVIMELERHNEAGHSIFIIGHQAVLRCIYAYFMNFTHEELPYIKIPLHTIVKLTPKAYECHEERFPVNVPAVDTHRPKPSKPGIRCTPKTSPTSDEVSPTLTDLISAQSQVDGTTRTILSDADTDDINDQAHHQQPVAGTENHLVANLKNLNFNDSTISLS